MSIATLFTSPATTLAISERDRQAVIYDTPFYDEADGGGGTCSTSAIPTSVNLPKPVIDGINKLKDIYVESGIKNNVPWQILAAIDFRESNNGPNQSMLGGEPLGSQALDSANAPKTKAESIDIGLKIVAGNLAVNYPDSPLKADPTPEDVKRYFITYNRGGSYRLAGLPPDASPYVMNQFDAARMDMVFPNIKGETLAGRTDKRLGAFTIYSALTGVAGGSCEGTSNVKVVAIAQTELAKNIKEIPDGSNSGPGIDTYTDGNPEFWCADFVSWVYMTAGSPFTGGSSGGWRLPAVKGLEAWLTTNGIFVPYSKTAPAPLPGDVITFDYKKFEESANSQNHTGIIETVDGDTITTIEGNASDAVIRRTYNIKTYEFITGWGRMK